MEIKVGLNGAYYKLVIDQKELNELCRGVDTSCDRGTCLDGGLAQTLANQLQEFATK